MHIVLPSKLLTVALGLDVVARSVIALLQLSDLDTFAATFALPRPLLFGAGLFHVAYAILLMCLVCARQVWSALIDLVVAANIAWSLACLGVLLAGLVSPSGMGVAFVLLHAAVALSIAGLESAGLHRSEPAESLAAT
jgi:hypothetical protein